MASSAAGGGADGCLAQIIRNFVRLQIEHRDEVALCFREAKNLPAKEAEACSASKQHFHRMLRALLKERSASSRFETSNPSLAASALSGMAVDGGQKEGASNSGQI